MVEDISGSIGRGGYESVQNDSAGNIWIVEDVGGDPSPDVLLGARVPRAFKDGWRLFYTAQHGDNVTWEILPAPGAPPLLTE